jgi:tetratricopeptide (TPR) repeat protein
MTPFTAFFTAFHPRHSGASLAKPVVSAPSSKTAPPARVVARSLRSFPSLAALILAFAFAPAAFAQTARWDPSSGSLAQGQTSQIRLVFENCKPNGNPSVPDVPGLAMQYLGPNTSFSFTFSNNTRVTREDVSFNYAVRPGAAAPVTIPSFTVETDKGHVTVPPAQFSISPPAANTTRTLDSVVTGRFDMPKEVWAGSVFPFTYTVNVSQQFYNSQNYPQWTPDPLVMDSWREPRVEQGLLNGEPRQVFVFSNRALARQPGTVTLNPASQIIKLNTGRRNTGPFGFMGFDTSEAFEIKSDAPAITIKPLPPGAPASFAGAVGQFLLDSKIVPQSVKVGEPITWTLTLTGTGNWPDIPNFAPRDVSKAFHAITSQPKRAIKEGTLFEGELTQDIVLVPTETGTYRLGPIDWTYFDPAAGEYKTIHIPLITLDVAAAPNASASAAAGAAGTAGAAGLRGADDSPVGGGFAAAPPAPAAIPRDPLPGGAGVPVPVTVRALVIRALAVLALVPLAWILMALKRAFRTDPARPRREARRRLAQTLQALDATADRGHTARLLQAWQRDTAILWQLPQTVPAAENLRALAKGKPQKTPANGATHGSADTAGMPLRPEPARDFADKFQAKRETGHARAPVPVRGTAAPEVWADLWAESDRVLYAARAPHSPDWTARAAEALAAARPPRFNPLGLLRPRNFFPFLSSFLFIFIFLSTAPRAAAQSAPPARAATSGTVSPSEKPAPNLIAIKNPGLGYYTAGDFSAAEKHWRDRLAVAPTDWIAHHNLALALAQQNKWAEAAAHATAAFVQNPSEPSVRWHLPVMMERAGYAPPVLVNFARPDLMHSLAARRSASGWQDVLLVSVALAAAALVLLLARAYALRKKLVLIPALALLLLLASALGVAISITSLCAWSPVSDTRTVIVWQASTLRSIPTDADTTQKTTPLPAGSVALVDKTFLGWSRLVFENGQTGWTRREVFVSLWK